MNLDQAIVRLIDEVRVTDQAQFLSLLKDRGFFLTQPTLSRHLKKLSVMKRDGHYQRVDTGTAEVPAYTLAQVPPNLLVLKTRPGHAQLVGYRLDSAHITGLTGTVAGDDTVFIAINGDLVKAEEQIRRALS
jgi:transcriptional regulator of arginine metabolism